MAKVRILLLTLGIPGLLGFGILVFSQWQAASSLAEFVALQKTNPPDSQKSPVPEIVARKESALARATRHSPDNPEPAYQWALLKMVQVESRSLSPSSNTNEGSTNPGPDPVLRGLLGEALRSVNGAITRDPGRADYHFLKAVVLQNLKGEESESAQDPWEGVVAHVLRTADSLDPFLPSLHFKIGSFWLALGDRAEAKKSFTVALKDSYQYARPVFDLLWSASEDVAEMKTLIGDDPLARVLLGDFLWVRGFKMEAEIEYAAAARDRPMEFRVCELLVQQYFRTGQFDKAREILGILLEEPHRLSEDESARARYFEGQSYYLEARYQDAISSFESALQLEPGLYYVHQALGDVYTKVGDLDRAIARFMFVLEKTGDKLSPKDSAELRVQLAGAYEKKKLYLEALNQYFRATQLDPTNRVAREKAVELGRDHL